MSLDNAAAYLKAFYPADLEMLYGFWGARHGAARTDPLALKRLPWEQQQALYNQFRRHLDTDEGPTGIYSDGRRGWDSLDARAASARMVGFFLRARFDPDEDFSSVPPPTPVIQA